MSEIICRTQPELTSAIELCKSEIRVVGEWCDVLIPAGSMCASIVVEAHVTGNVWINGSVGGDVVIGGTVGGEAVISGSVGGDAEIRGKVGGFARIGGTVGGFARIDGTVGGFARIGGTVGGFARIDGSVGGDAWIGGTVGGLRKIGGHIAGFRVSTPDEELAALRRIAPIILAKDGRWDQNTWHGDGWCPEMAPEEAMACGTPHCAAGWLQAADPRPEIRKLHAAVAGAIIAPTMAAHGEFSGIAGKAVLARMRAVMSEGGAK